MYVKAKQREPSTAMFMYIVGIPSRFSLKNQRALFPIDHDFSMLLIVIAPMLISTAQRSRLSKPEESVNAAGWLLTFILTEFSSICYCLRRVRAHYCDMGHKLRIKIERGAVETKTKLHVLITKHLFDIIGQWNRNGRGRRSRCRVIAESDHKPKWIIFSNQK